MPHRKTEFLADHYYHLCNRGIARTDVFHSADNYRYFVRLLRSGAQRHSVDIVAYCLMPNHYHLLVKPKADNRVSHFIQSVAGSYTQALNLRLQRQGPLFQGRFRAVLVDKEEYLVSVACYIHANPVLASLATAPEAWPYSNYADLVGMRCQQLGDSSLVPERFPTGHAYRTFVESYVRDRKDAKGFERYLLEVAGDLP